MNKCSVQQLFQREPFKLIGFHDGCFCFFRGFHKKKLVLEDLRAISLKKKKKKL